MKHSKQLSSKNQSSNEQNQFNIDDKVENSHLSEDQNLRAIIEVNEHDPEIIKYEQECEKFKSLYHDIKSFGQLGDLLFEEFMLIGPDLQELQALVYDQPSPFEGGKGTNLEYTKGNVQQTILFNKPGYASPLICEKRQMVSQFAFPQGLQYYRYKNQTDLQNIPSRFKEIILLNLCSQPDSGINQKVFVLNMRGEESNINVNNSLQSINSNSILYAVCYQQEDILVISDEKTGEKNIFLFPVVYSFLTYYPFVSYFQSIILEIVHRIKTIRLVKSSFSGVIDNNLQNADISKVLETLLIDRDLCMSLKSLQIKDVKPDCTISYYLNTPQNYLLNHNENEVEGYGSEQKISFNSLSKENENNEFETTDSFQPQSDNQLQKVTIQSFRVPPIEEMGYIEGLEAAYLTFSNLPYYDFQIILTLILLEKKVVFLSKNITLLTLTTLTFQTLFQPIKYPHPIIFSITDDLMYFLEAPVPIIIGVNLSAKKFEYQYGYNDECYYVDLDKNYFIQKNQDNISKIEEQKYQFSRNKEQIKTLFKEINNDITSKQFGNKFKKLLKKSNYDKKLNYQPDSAQLNNLKTLLQVIRKSFQESIISRLPNHPIFSDQNKSELDMGAFQKQILRDNPESSFLQNFVETQIFSYYLEQRYF